ncbi:SulP family inorganic anion transporter [Ruminococcus flavefaciens]|uniref:SulP family inorganic anion transporter n=1 Tax=Ruminococcus flavefaciens TaxID=1265 RepID=UPI0026EBA922|nr:SulP family inorganic anion transporter [Ruminococcus flavefaciens]MDD7516758.1 SulP family inorganic anion transporter [Ruminococcus flavefaciens]MDY5691963.1 SulP family inorganic anion transporter [Ruminococcus flavefaciens]
MAEKAVKPTEEKLKPKLFSVMKTYSKEQFIKDIIAGIIVAIIALPLSIALALASGVGPEQGLYTAIIAGFIVSFLGGSRVQIAGPTAAFATTVAGIVATEGMSGLAIATIMAGIILIVMGLCHFGALIKYIPGTITTGFTFGIAVTILLGQVKDFLGLTFDKEIMQEKLGFSSPIETIEKIKAICLFIGSTNVYALLIGLLSLAILILWPKKLEKIPASLIAVIVCSAVVKLSGLKVNTIGDLYTISNSLPKLTVPEVTFARVRSLVPNAFTIAVLAAVESLLSCVVADGMVGSKHRSNMELIAQGTANIGSAFFGGIPATGAIARTAANVKNGGRTPISGMVHSIVLVIILVLLMPYASLIPMPTIAAILFIVAYNMCGWRNIRNTVKTAPKSDIAVLFVTLILTVVFDLVVAIGVGMVMASLLFMKRMADVTEAHAWVDIDDEDTDPDNILLKKIPQNTRVFEINGPMFFAASDKYKYVLSDKNIDVLCIRMRNVPAMDATGVEALIRIVKRCQRHNVKVVFSHVNEQPMKVMTKAGFIEQVGKENFCDHIDTALLRAEELEKEIAAKKA